MNKFKLYKMEDKRIREEWFKDHVAKIQSFDNGNLLKIKWKKPGTWNYAIVYYIDQKMGYLCVCGDLGEAVYQWHPPINMEFFGKMELDYFNGKCQASSCGERGKTWNQEVAVSYVKSYIETNTLGEDQGDSLFETIYGDGYIEESLKSLEPDLALLYTEEEYKSWRALSRNEKDRFIVVAKGYLKDLNTTGKWNSFSKYDYRRELIEKQHKFDDLESEAIEACESEFQWHRFLSEKGYDFFGECFYEYGDIGKTISIRVQSHLIGLKMIQEGIRNGKFVIPKSFWSRLTDWFNKNKNKYFT